MSILLVSAVLFSFCSKLDKFNAITQEGSSPAGGPEYSTLHSGWGENALAARLHGMIQAPAPTLISSLGLSGLSFLICKVGIVHYSHRVARRVEGKRDVMWRAPGRWLDTV